MALGKLKEKKGQQYLECAITGCTNKGRVIARLGDMEIAYCAVHRKKYGERVINALINAVFNYKLSKFLTNVKKDLIMNPYSQLSEESRKFLLQYIIDKTEELEALETAYKKVEELSSSPDKDLEDISLD